MPTPNLRTDLKENWVSSEIVMPPNVNDWSSRINNLNKILPVYSATGSFYKATMTGDTYNLIPVTFTDDTQNVCPSSYVEGMSVIFEIPATNLKDAKVNVNGIGAKFIRNTNNTNVSAGVLRNLDYAKLRYVSSQDCFHLEGTSYANVDLNNLSATGEARFTRISSEIQTFRGYINAIGQPLARFDNYIDNTTEVRLEGGKYAIADYPLLYQVYGTKFNAPDTEEGYFNVPDLRNRVLWGSEDTNGYIPAGLPNVKGGFKAAANMEGTNSIYGTSGAFTYSTFKTGRECRLWGDKGNRQQVNFNAGSDAATEPEANGIYRDDCFTVQPPGVKTRFVTRYK